MSLIIDKCEKTTGDRFKFVAPPRTCFEENERYNNNPMLMPKQQTLQDYRKYRYEHWVEMYSVHLNSIFASLHAFIESQFVDGYSLSMHDTKQAKLALFTHIYNTSVNVSKHYYFLK